MEYATVSATVATTGMVVRGGFPVDPDDDTMPPVPSLPDGRRCRTVVVVGNVGRAMWPGFRGGETAGPDPLDRWTRAQLQPIAERFGATFVHPSDEPFQPFQRWAQRADDVWSSPIGLLVHHAYGLWHAYRGAFLFGDDVVGLPEPGAQRSPCLTCIDQPCLTTCPVDAFTATGYDNVACAQHVRSDREPACLSGGCAARCACPVGVEFRYGPDQMRFHMEAFVGS